MNKQNKPISKTNFINLVGVFAIFALIGFCCWFGKSSTDTTTSSVSTITVKEYQPDRIMQGVKLL